MAWIFSRFGFCPALKDFGTLGAVGSTALLLLLLGPSACATQTPEPPKPPPRQAHQVDPPPERTRIPHVAPPPAYGNKVVQTKTQAAEGLSPSETL